VVVMRGRIGMPGMILVVEIAVDMVMMMTSMCKLCVIVTIARRVNVFISTRRRMIV
jgi:hypothetical protein